MSWRLSFLGGAGTVTGSRYVLEGDGRRLLVDCGLFQGPRSLRDRNRAPFPVGPAALDAVILTHAHLDHSGYLPVLVRDGFHGRVHCTEPTADLCRLLLLDAADVGARRSGDAALFSLQDVVDALARFAPVPFGAPLDLPGGVRLELRRAGHVLGAATVTLERRGRRAVFSGDLGRYGDPLMHDPEPVHDADWLVLESTYGDRTHPTADPAEALGAILDRTLGRGGTVVVAAFAVGRVQLLLYHLWRLRRSGRLGSTEIYVDSPLAIEATKLLIRHPHEHRLPQDVCVEVLRTATYVHGVAQSEAMAASPSPKVILSASGMAEGGRVLAHLKRFGPDPRNAVVFAGFQAPGTRGAALVGGAGEIEIDGERLACSAEVAHLPELSAHADADEILRWLGGFRRPPRRTYIVHGEPAASSALRARIERELGWACVVPAPLQTERLE